VKTRSLSYNLIVLFLRASLVTVLIAAGWLVYQKLPDTPSSNNGTQSAEATIVQVFLRRDQKTAGTALDVPLELYPIDIVAVRHEFFTERRAGERFDDFLKQRMKGRQPISSRFDMQGQATLSVTPGNWWIHATLPGDEELEWHLPVSIGGHKQLIELTSQNAYTRTKTF
jgi:hypothetical protein